jgi:hypothetical protein
LRGAGNFYANLQIRHFGGADFHSPRGIWRDWEAQIEPDLELFASASSDSGSAKRFGFRYNLET